MEHGRYFVVPDIVYHNIATKCAHSQLVWICTHAHRCHSASLTSKEVLIKTYVALRSQVVHQETSLLCWGKQDMRAIWIWQEHVKAASNFIISIFQVNFCYIFVIWPLAWASWWLMTSKTTWWMLHWTLKVMNLDSSWACDGNRLSSINHSNLVDAAISLWMNAVSRAWRNIFFNVLNFPHVHCLVLSRAGEEVLLVIAYGNCIHWILVLIQSCDKQALWSDYWQLWHLLNLPFSYMIFCQPEAFLHIDIEVWN